MDFCRFLFRDFLDDGWRLDDHAVCLSSIYFSLVDILRVPVGKSQRHIGKKTKEAKRLKRQHGLFSPRFKRGKYLQIHSLPLSRAADWSWPHSSNSVTKTLPCASGHTSPGDTERNKGGPWTQGTHVQIRKTGEEIHNLRKSWSTSFEGQLKSSWGSATSCVTLGKLLHLSMPVYSAQHGTQVLSTVSSMQEVLNKWRQLLLVTLQEVFSGVCLDKFGVHNGDAELGNIQADFWNMRGHYSMRKQALVIQGRQNSNMCIYLRKEDAVIYFSAVVG